MPNGSKALVPVSKKEARHLRLSGLKPDQQARVFERVAECLDTINRSHPVRGAHPAVIFDLTGMAAGQYRRRRSGPGQILHELRFNPYLLSRNFEDSLNSTVPHEVAHYAVAVLYKGRRRPHGREWANLMQLLDADLSTTHKYDTSGLNTRCQRRWRYRCGCRDHELTTTRHRRATEGMEYRCRACGHKLVFRGNEPETGLVS